ncbi:MAG: hypothetical protein ACI9IT_002606, partial [Glaciecola sp.]
QWFILFTLSASHLNSFIANNQKYKVAGVNR